MQLSPNFADTELGVEQAPVQVVVNATCLCDKLLEPIRAHFGGPVGLSCGWRPPAHNAAVGGKKDSQHLYLGGNSAGDIEKLSVPLQEGFDWIRLESGLPFDQLILEGSNSTPRCIHISYNSARTAQRRQALTGSTGAGKVYIPVKVGP